MQERRANGIAGDGGRRAPEIFQARVRRLHERTDPDCLVTAAENTNTSRASPERGYRGQNANAIVVKNSLRNSREKSRALTRA